MARMANRSDVDLSGAHPTPPDRAQLVYDLAVFLRWFSATLPMALLVLLLQSRGLNLFHVGLFMAVHSAVIIVLEVPSGGLADSIGRKRVAILAQVFTLSSTLVLLVAFPLWAFVAAALLMGTGRALSSGALDAWFVDTLLANDAAIDLQPPLARAQAVAIVGMALGSLSGGAIPQLLGASLPPDGTAVLTPLSLPLLASVAVQALLIVLLALLVREVRPPSTEGGGASTPRGIAALRPILAAALRAARDDRVVTLILVSTAAAGLAVASLETFWQPRFATLLGGRADADPAVFGGVLAGAFAVGVVGNLVSIPLARLWRRRYGRVAALGQAVAGVALLILAGREGVPAALVAFWLAYLGNALSASPIAAILNEEVPSQRRSATLSVVSLAGYVGALVGSITFGALAETAGIPTVWIVAGTVLAASALLLLAVDRIRSARLAGDAADARAA